MPDLSLQINAPIEPLSPKAKEGLGEFLMCDSQAYYSLYRELSEYVEGRISGRSILVSGHRGSGKTTLVHRAIVEIKEGLIRNKSNHRLLLVNIHGPSLFETSDGKIIKKKNPVSSQLGRNEENKRGNDKSNGNENEGNRNGNNDSNVNKESERKVDASSDNNIFLEQITVALYKAYATEIIEKFKELKNSNNEVDDRLIARLALDLQNAASHSELGLFWRKTNLLNDENNNGFNELLALASVSQAYRTIVGDLNLTITNEDDNSIEGKQNAEFKSKNFFEKFKPIATEIWSLLAGSAVFTGVLIDEATYDFKGLIAALAAIVTAFFTNFTLSLTINRSRKSTFKKEFTFIRDKKAETLSREIPVLIERLKGAGCYPVFVVDELDKIVNDTDGAKAFRELISEAKHLIADRSFFCFLTDRNYYDYLSEVFKKESYPIEHTLFSSRFFIAYGPQFLHDYLVRLFEEDLKKYFDVTKGIQDKEKLAQIYCFFFRSLYKSRFHVGDLNRNLFSSISKSNGGESGATYEVVIPDRIAETESAYSIQIAIQLVIEYMILGYDNGSLKTRLDQEPSFSQIVFDTLYYPSRQWEMGERILSINQEDFKRYLEGRVLQIKNNDLTSIIPGSRIDNFNPEATEKENEEATVNNNNNAEGFINDIDFKYLYGLVAKMVEFLCDTKTLKYNLLEENYIEKFPYKYEGLKTIWKRWIVEIIPENGLLHQNEEDPLKHSWKYDFFGRLLDPEISAKEERRIIDLVDRYRLLISVVESLSSERINKLNFPNRKGSHTSFLNALERIGGYRNNPISYKEIHKDLKELEDFKESANYIFNFIKRITYLITRCVGLFESNHDKFSESFWFMLDQLSVTSLISDEIKTVLKKDEMSFGEFSIPEARELMDSEEWNLSSSWILTYNRIKDKKFQIQLSLSEKENWNNAYWETWFERIKWTLTKRTTIEKQIKLSPIDLIFNEYISSKSEQSKAIFNPKFGLSLIKRNEKKGFELNLNHLTRYEWTEMFFGLFLKRTRTDENYIPIWMSIPAMLWLGFYGLLERMIHFLDEQSLEQGIDPGEDNEKDKEEFKKSKEILTFIRENKKEIFEVGKSAKSLVILVLPENTESFFDEHNQGVKQFPGLLVMPHEKIELMHTSYWKSLFIPENIKIIFYGAKDTEISLPSIYDSKLQKIEPVFSKSIEKKEDYKIRGFFLEKDLRNDPMTKDQLLQHINELLSDVQFFEEINKR